MNLGDAASSESGQFDSFYRKKQMDVSSRVSVLL